MPRPAKRLFALGVDAGLCVFTVWLSFGLRLDEWGMLTGNQWLPVITAVAFALPVFVVSGFYRAIFRYAGWAALAAIAKAMVLYGVLFAAVFTFASVPGVPRTVGVIQPLLLLLTVGGSRIAVRYWLGGIYQSRLKRQGLPRVLIYGAGSAGRKLAAVLRNSREMAALGFVDDDSTLQGNTINGLPVFSPTRLEVVINKLGITDVLLAIPSVTRARRNAILATLQTLSLRVRTLPSLMDLAHGRVQAADIRDLDIEDLLGRDQVPPNAILLNKSISNKVVLVTGAGGSIGSELCRQIIKGKPSVLLLVDHCEFALYAIHHELNRSLIDERVEGLDIVPLLASVRDAERMRDIVGTWQPHTVYHAAAYKHVPLVEHNPTEGIKNNVLGTLTVARIALENRVSEFVLISTDKAVRPTNIMGASKRLAELVLQALAKLAQENGKPTKFSMVRFGNVLGSSGSVVPLFRQQIKDGGPITLTHADITRYFMTIPEAAQLVIQAGAMALGGEVFVLDMGEPVRIRDLAYRIVELSGLTVKDEKNPHGDIEVQITGLRPGEKLFEELLIGDNPQHTQHQRIMKAHEDFMPWEELEKKIDVLIIALNTKDVGMIRRMLEQLVSDYRPIGEVVDWVHLAQAIDGAAENVC